MTTMSLPEVAATLGVHIDTVRALVRSGELQAVNVSANPRSLKPRFRVTQDALAGFLAKRSTYQQPRPQRRKARKQFPEYV